VWHTNIEPGLPKRQLVFNFFLLQPRCFLAEARTKRSCGPDRIQLRSRLANIPGTDQPLTLAPPDSESPLAAESVPMPAAIAAAFNRTRSGIPRSERRQLCATTDLSRIAGNLRALRRFKCGRAVSAVG
jgi:hypothetical protein